MSAIAENSLYPWEIAENIATRSAHNVVGYALDSILQPNITKSSVVNKAVIKVYPFTPHNIARTVMRIFKDLRLKKGEQN